MCICSITVGNCVSFRVSNGVQQGLLSPALFNVFMNEFSEKLSDRDWMNDW